ncbi:MAG: PrpR N-terminal domain-containing protein [Firmicutes bacterium]|nr:PrpR N-terminal domain-containing protein [Bacillota bacterium]
MNQKKIRVLGIAPYDGIRLAMLKEAPYYPQLSLDVYTGDLEEGLQIVKEMDLANYDVIISRGGTADLIRSFAEIPVISIQISVYDILRTLKMAENYTMKLAITGFPAITKPAHILCDLLQNHMDIFTIESREEVGPLLEKLVASGFHGLICDNITHTTAREMGIDAFLVTSGPDGIQQAFEQVLYLTRSYSRIRQENQYLKAFGQDSGEQLIVLSPDGDLDYYTGARPLDSMLDLLRPHISQVTYGRVSQFFINHSSRLYQISARKLSGDAQDMTVFRCQSYLIPAVAKNHGIRVVSNVECAHLFQQSFFSLSGAMGELEQKVRAIASTGQSVMILGEPGTGKVQIARALYLYSNQPFQPMISIDCDLMNERSWDFLFEHASSPLSNQHGTIYFQHLESIPEKRQIQLLAALAETNLANRMQLLFSCSFTEGKPLNRVAALIQDRIGCQILSLPTLRSRQDEIPSLASLYLSSLNMELGKQIIGPELDASRMMQRYDWPGNYMQFKQILGELAVLTDASYIRSSDVSEMLSRERSLHPDYQPQILPDNASMTLEEITLQAVTQTLKKCGQNQSAAAKMLGISRSTLWRYMKQLEEK